MKDIEKSSVIKRNVGILTYNIKHRKTYDTLCLLKARGYQNVTVYVQPLYYQKTYEPILQHRPVVTMEIPDIDILCKNFSYSIVYGNIEQIDIPDSMILLVCGAGIIPDSVRETHIIINSHPGYIPFVRGLDSFKWAIWEENPIGVSTHLIGEYVDAGEIIDRKIIEIHENTTFFEAAQCVYENEINMLVDAIEKIDDLHFYVMPNNNIIHRRMPHEIEMQLLKKFEEYKLQLRKGNIKFQ